MNIKGANTQTLNKEISASDFKFAIVLSRFNESIGKRLLDGAIDCLKKHGCKDKNIEIINVPGAFEIPLAADKAAEKNKYNSIICLGAVIRGETPHFEYVSSAVSSGVLQVGLKHGLPVIFGVLTTDNLKQAKERSGKKSGNKGWEAALAAIDMANLLTKLKKSK
jgi:6,7-dimethyl-8-ribityllumazine synthase